MLYVTVLIFICIAVFMYYKSQKEDIPSSNKQELIKGYELVVTPSTRTRLKILKMRGTTFKSKEGVKDLDFKPHEAALILRTASWKELGIDLPEMEDDTTATPVGPLKARQLEIFYKLLEDFREIIEDKRLPPCEKVKRVGKIKSKYFPDFITKHTAIIELTRGLTNIDGISQSIADQLFNMGIYEKEQVSKLTQKELMKIKGIGKVKSKQIIQQLKS